VLARAFAEPPIYTEKAMLKINLRRWQQLELRQTAVCIGQR